MKTIIQRTPISRGNWLEVFNQIPDRIYFKDSQSRFIEVNQAVLSLFGLQNPEQIYGKSDFDFFSHNHAQAAFEDEQSIICTGKPVVGRMERETFANCHEVWVSTTKIPIHSETGEITGIFGITRDITDSRSAEERHKDKEFAAQSCAAKSRFLAQMCHEIRTPLGGMIGMMELLSETPLNEEQADYVRTIQDCGDSLLHILNDILDFSKIESGHLAFENIPFDLGSVLHGVQALFKEKASKKGIMLEESLAGNCTFELMGDPLRLRQILMNLVGNAIKFTPSGKVTIQVSTEQEVQDKIQMRFEVQDGGIGMSLEQQSRLFKPFSQGDASTSRRFGGSGLGLAISKELVEKMAGQIGCTSTPGAGSTFWFTAFFEKQNNRNPGRESKKDRADYPVHLNLPASLAQPGDKARDARESTQLATNNGHYK